jgi:hypothetical protein
MQTNKPLLAGYVLLGTILAFGFYGVGKSMASAGNEYFGHESYHEAREDGDDGHARRRKVAVDPLYAEECSGCHMAYPGQLLPAASWRKVMANLEDHFGENAELDAATRQSIETYLVDASLDGGYRKLFRNLGERKPLRITELPYFVHEHDEIPSRLIEGNEKVRSLSQCNACHRGAEQGHFDEDDVVIAGFGRWDD